MRASQKTRAIADRIERRTGKALDFDSAHVLRRAERTLQRWYEAECGDASGTCIERDETSGKPFRVHYYVGFGAPNGGPRRYPIADREAGAIRRIKAVCESYKLHYFIQTDPRGCALYVSTEPMTDSDYSMKGVAVCE